MHPSRLTLARVLFVIAIASIATVANAAPASAHAVVTSSTPGDGERLATPPTSVTIKFSENISSDLGGFVVLDAKGDRVDRDDSNQPSSNSLRVTLGEDLPNGTYIANYKVVSADGHPISGALVFGVGSATLTDLSTLAGKNDPTVESIGSVARFITYLGALAAAGVAFFLGFIHDWTPDRKRLAVVVRWATIAAGTGIVATIVIQAALATGRGLGAAFDMSTLRPVLRQGVGAQSAVLLIGLAFCYLSVATKRPFLSQAFAFYGGVAATSAFVLWGHATESPRSSLAVPADITHVAVAAVWFGGLIGLGCCLAFRSRPAVAPDVVHTETGIDAGSNTPENADANRSGAESRDSTSINPPGSLLATATMVQRFSTTAAISVFVLVLAGSGLAASELGSWSAFTTTTYGKTLLMKLSVVATILAIAGFNRFRLLPLLTGKIDEQDERQGNDDEERERPARELWRPLINTVRLEATGIVAVLALTAVLVNITPSVTVPVASEPLQASEPFDGGRVELTITPNRPGINNIHVSFLDNAGKPIDPAAELGLELRLPDKNLGPISRPMVKAAAGHFILDDISELSIPGSWEITLVSRVSQFTQRRTTFHDTIN